MSDEKTSPRVAEIASRALRGEHITWEELRSLAASALTQAADKEEPAATTPDTNG